MLEVHGLSAAYGAHPALVDVDLRVERGEIVVILGANGAGKSTLLRAIAGVCQGKVEGAISLDGSSLTGISADRIVEKGVAFVPEGRGIFGDLTVGENLLLGAYASRARAQEDENLDRVLKLFPTLADRKDQVARTMSGGEQQMVAIGRAMMSNPQILMLDEPSLGLSPLLCKELFQNLERVKGLGIGILMVEQNARQSLAIADRGYLLETARITHEAPAAALMNDPAVQAAYLGASGKAAPVHPPSAAGATAPPPTETPTPSPPPLPAAGFAARPQARRSAEEHIGLSIDDMVDRAARSAAVPRDAQGPVDRADVDKLVGQRVDTLLRDFERAAAAARNRPERTARPAYAPSRARRSAPVTAAPAPRAEGHDGPDGPTPIIEIYRRPRVAVYKRGPDGTFERE